MSARIAWLVLGFLPALPLAAQDGQFVPAGAMQVPRWGHTATALSDGRVLIAGGSTASGVVHATAEVYDPATGAFAPVGPLQAARYGHSATLLADGRVLLVGGYGPEPSAQASAELFDPVLGTFAPTGDLATAQVAHSATLLGDGRVLIAGGQHWVSGSTSIVAAAAELYDPDTGEFSGAPPYAVGNTMYASANGPLAPRATMLADGTVLLTGNGTAERFDPAGPAFVPSAPMSSTAYRFGMYGHASTLLGDGTVLVTGGTDEWSLLRNAERFEPAFERFTELAAMTAPRGYHTATLLADGRVLVVGGETEVAIENGVQFGGSLASTEYYLPGSRTFAPGPDVGTARAGHTATRLPDGSVLIVGGIDFPPYPATRHPLTLASAERFVPSAGETAMFASGFE